MGIEALYSTYTNQDERDMRRLADQYDLLLSGGSDFHGENKPGLDLAVGYGKLFVPEEILSPIRSARSTPQSCSTDPEAELLRNKITERNIR